MKNAEYSHRRKWQIMIFLAAFLPRAICTSFMVPVKVLMDEVCTLNGAAHFAGLDWSHVVEKGAYYGFGFYGLLSFIFRLTDNPFIICHFILLVLVILQSVTALICFHLLTEKFGIQDYLWGAITAVTCSYMVVSRAIAFVNEHPLILITWIAVWLILLLCESHDNKGKAIYTFLIVLLFSYSLLLHTRALTYWIAFAILVVTYGLAYRKCLVSIPVFAAAAVVAIPAGKWLIKNYQNDIWKTAKTVANTAINASTPAFSLDSIKGLTAIVLGEINTIGAYTGGISYIAIITCIYILFKCLNRREKTEAGDDKLFAIIIFCGACVAITIVGMFPTWGPGIIIGINKGITKNYYSYKGLTYLRYFGPYLGPLLMVMLLFAGKCKSEMHKIIFAAIVVIIPVQIYWMENIIPLIAKNSNTNPAFMLFALWHENKGFGSYIYYIGIMYMVFMPFAYQRLLYYKEELASLLLVLAILFAQYIYSVYAMDVPWAEKNIVQADSGYKWIKELENKIELPDEVYVKDNISTTWHKSYYIYQFMLNRYVIMPQEPDETIDEAILFENTEDNIESLQQRGFEYMQLDDNEYVFVKGAELKKQLQEIGINMEGVR